MEISEGEFKGFTWWLDVYGVDNPIEGFGLSLSSLDPHQDTSEIIEIFDDESNKKVEKVKELFKKYGLEEPRIYHFIYCSVPI